MIEFTLVEGVVEGKAGFGPHFVEVWAAPSTKKQQGHLFVTLFTSVASWVGEAFRVEEFAKHVALKVHAQNNTGNWQVEIAYNTTKQRWVANAKHLSDEGVEGLTKSYTEWAGT